MRIFGTLEAQQELGQLADWVDDRAQLLFENVTHTEIQSAA
jgi:hypothetical protein